MFTGITRGVHPVVFARKTGDVQTYGVRLPASLAEGLELGASVAVDGVCQTVTALQSDGEGPQGSRVVTFDAIVQTLAVTTLGSLEPGASVAIERSVRVGDEVGGHRVAGHVTGTGTVAEVDTTVGGVHDVWFRVPLDWQPFIVPQGFIAIDGSSLTVGQSVEATCSRTCRFGVHLIPETLRTTNLGNKKVGDKVNIELDATTVTIVRTVNRVLERDAQMAALKRDVKDSPA